MIDVSERWPLLWRVTNRIPQSGELDVEPPRFSVNPTHPIPFHQGNKMTKKTNEIVIDGAYKKIPEGMIMSKEFNALKPSANRVYMVMFSRYVRLMPDEPFAMPYDEIKAITGLSQTTISNSIKSLMKAGYIKIPQKGRYPHNVSLYKIDREPLERRYPKYPHGKGTWPDYLKQLKEGVE